MSAILDVLTKERDEVLAGWIKELMAASGTRLDLIREDELRSQCARLMDLMAQALKSDPEAEMNVQAWAPVKEMLEQVSRSRAIQGFSPSETATFVFSLKRPIMGALQRVVGDDAAAMAREVWTMTILVDRLGLHTFEAFQKSREEVISRQQQEMLELSTPVVELWDNILALPLIGTLDSERTQVVMESLLERIVETGAEIAIIDITGVPTVDTLVAQHLLKTVAAARLMGSDCIISGIRPQIAQTIVHLGISLNEITTKATMADAFKVALKRIDRTIVHTKAGAEKTAEKIA